MARKRVTRGGVKPAGVNGQLFDFVDTADLVSSADEGVLAFVVSGLEVGIGMRIQVYYSVNNAGYRIGQSVLLTSDSQSYAVGSGIPDGATIDWFMQLRTSQGELITTEPGIPFVTDFS